MTCAICLTCHAWTILKNGIAWANRHIGILSIFSNSDSIILYNNDPHWFNVCIRLFVDVLEPYSTF